MSVSSLKMEVPEAASARAAPATAALSRAGAVAMCAMSLLFAWLAAGTLRRCGGMDDDEEEVFSCVLWGLSPLIWAYLYSWTAALSPAPPRAEDGGGGTINARTATACLLLVAAAADRLIAPVAGAAAIVIAPLCAACACGRGLAERQQRAGTERWSASTVTATPSYQSRAEEREQRERKVHAVSTMETLAVAVSASLWSMSRWFWPRVEAAERELEREAPPTDQVVFLYAGPLILALGLMLAFLARSPFLAKIDDMRAFAAVIAVIGWVVTAASASALFGTIAWTVVVWMGELGMLGFLGYFLAVDAYYEELMVIERREPRTAKDASGLLDGRDSGDACSAHIDAAGSVCVDCDSPGRCKCTCRSKIIR